MLGKMFCVLQSQFCKSFVINCFLILDKKEKIWIKFMLLCKRDNFLVDIRFIFIEHIIFYHSLNRVCIFSKGLAQSDRCFYLELSIVDLPPEFVYHNRAAKKLEFFSVHYISFSYQRTSIFTNHFKKFNQKPKLSYWFKHAV